MRVLPFMRVLIVNSALNSTQRRTAGRGWKNGSEGIGSYIIGLPEIRIHNTGKPNTDYAALFNSQDLTQNIGR